MACVFFLGIAGGRAEVSKQAVPGAYRVQQGIASFYGDKYHGRPTASGEIFDMYKLTAAHPTLPFGTLVKITNLRNNLSVTVRINDRGPFVGDRVIDLSLAAAKKLDMIESGIVPVRIEPIQ